MVQLAYGEPCWLATRYRDVRTIYTDRRFSRRLPPDDDPPGIWPSPARSTPPTRWGWIAEHAGPRRITAPVFSPRSIRALGDTVQGHVDELLDRIVEDGSRAPTS